MASIRTSMVGKDANRNEYWHFKEDDQHIYIRKEENKEVTWHYIDEEEKYDMLTDSMNIKGIRERKLLENLKK